MNMATIVEALSDACVLVAMDFDGTLSEIARHADEAVPVGGAVEALETLARRPDTVVAVVSGRSLADLRRMLGPAPGVVMVGEHGATWEGAEPTPPPGFDHIREGLESIAERHPGAWVEVKAASLVFHTRQVDAEGPAVDEVTGFLASVGHDRFELGKRVVDVGFIDASKGSAVDILRRRFEADRVVFAGDDRTDESVFESLGEGDVGIKVGPGPTAAGHRLAGPDEVVVLLGRLGKRPAAGRPCERHAVPFEP
jgi:trehalose 6-phosphate phosphatase